MSSLPAIQDQGGMLAPLGAETASSAVAAQAKAMVEARYVIAMRRPRIWDQVRQDILKECRRPSFAHNKSSFYRKPIGDGIEGLGIRFTEVALRCMTNVLIETTTIYEDREKEVVRVSVTDLEANVTYPMDVRVSKTVERSKPMDDGTFISVRKNSYGKNVYTVWANDDDLLNKRGALISKAQRTLALRLIPGDIQDEAEEIIKKVRLDKAAEDPDGERKRIADAFAELGVKAADLTEFLGHALDTCSPTELVNLRGIYGAIRDGEATWATVMENKAEQEAQKVKKPAGGEPQGMSADDFEKNLPGWTKLIADGKKTADEVIAMASTKAKLSDEQKATLRAVKPAATEGPKGAPQADAKKLEKRLKTATDLDLLAADADLIKTIDDESLRNGLTALYQARKAELEGEQQ
jgi:hypothetical protein